MKFDIKNIIFGMFIFTAITGTFYGVIALSSITDTTLIVNDVHISTGQECTVDDVNGDQTSLSGCITAVSNYGKIYVNDGTFTTNDIDIDKPLSIICDEGATLQLGTDSTYILNVDSTQDVEIKGCSFDGNGKDGHGIRITNSDNLRIINNKFKNLDYSGISLTGGERVLIDGNEFYNYSLDSAQDYAAVQMSATTKRNIISNNKIITSHGSGIELRGEHNTITDNNFEFTATTSHHGIYANGNYHTIMGNDFEIIADDSHGMYLINANYLNVQGNNIETNSATGHGYKIDDVNHSQIIGGVTKGGVNCMTIGANIVVDSSIIAAGECFGQSSDRYNTGTVTSTYSSLHGYETRYDLNYNSNGIYIDADFNGDDTKALLTLDYSGTGDTKGFYLIHNGGSTNAAEIAYSGDAVALKLSSTNSVNSMVRLDNTGDGSHIRFTGDPEIAAPADGDLWFNGTQLKMRIGSTTYNIDMTPE